LSGGGTETGEDQNAGESCDGSGKAGEGNAGERPKRYQIRERPVRAKKGRLVKHKKGDREERTDSGRRQSKKTGFILEVAHIKVSLHEVQGDERGDRVAVKDVVAVHRGGKENEEFSLTKRTAPARGGDR